MEKDDHSKAETATDTVLDHQETSTELLTGKEDHLSKKPSENS